MKGSWFIPIGALVLFGCSQDNSVNVSSRFDYSVEQTRSCFCPNGGKAATIFVVSDTIADAVWISDGSHLSPEQWAGFRTINGLFDEMTRWDTSRFNIKVIYDSLHGYPSLLSVYPKAVTNPDSTTSVILDAGVAYKTSNYVNYN